MDIRTVVDTHRNEEAGEDEFKYRGIECRQRCSLSYLDDAQKALIRAVYAYRDPEAVCEELRSWVDRLERGAVDPNELVITNRVSKRREDYTQSTRSVAALERAADLGLGRAPGQSVSYVVVDDAKQSRERVLLASEELGEYDVGIYRELLVRAAASVLSPLGWRESDIEEELGQYTESSLQSFV
ncbi:DNA polymerase domain-containing protein [Haladaptatus caseinilyticus]|uniref:DNA polymerase domain-containing protein n=1 Tax=Haladaptatus caseinilyticus TaxID=2993314 RepID=UPI00224A76A7|nr:DNA polymerase domain-containing protein [Haladaptatus caseinilyticus]